MSVPRSSHALVDAVDALLPQTQCRRCGFDACKPYAEALVAGVADLNRCPPGGDATIDGLARLLDREPRPLDADCGEYVPRVVAFIDEQWCIGCTLCIRACPIDAIVGARRLMHTVVAGECSGCELCVAPCPVDCIRMLPVQEPDVSATSAAGWFAPWSAAQAARARDRHRAREARLAERREQAAARRRGVGDAATDASARRLEVLESVRRVRARRPCGEQENER